MQISPETDGGNNEHDQSKRCGDLVQNLLSFSRVSPMNLAWCDLSQVIDRCVRLVQHKMDLAGVQLNLELAPDLPPAHCDPAQIEQVVLAMVINAIWRDPGPSAAGLVVIGCGVPIYLFLRSRSATP